MFNFIDGIGEKMEIIVKSIGRVANSTNGIRMTVFRGVRSLIK